MIRSAALEEGIALFNAQRFWHAHEAWERIWLTAEGEQKRFLQGLIQLAAAYHHVQRGTFSGGVRLFDAALEKLAAFPEGYAGVNRTKVVALAREHRQKIARDERIAPEELPKLSYN